MKVTLRFEIPPQTGNLQPVAVKILRAVSWALRDIVGYRQFKMEVEDPSGNLQKFAFDRRSTGERRKEQSFRRTAA